MSFQEKQRDGCWVRRVIQSALAVIIIAMGFDYGKHVVLKRVLKNEIAQSKGLVSLESISVSLWPLFQNHLVLKNFHVNVSGTPLTAVSVHLRQGWRDWHLAHIHALEVKAADSVLIQEVQGILDTTDLKTRVKASQLVLTGIEAHLPLLNFVGPRAFFDFLYEMGAHQLFLKGDAPEMSFSNGVTFGLSGQGIIHAKAPIRGKMDLKIKNIDKMMKELVAAGVVDASQASMIMMGSNFLSKIGLHDVTVPLKIQDGEVFLGPVLLFKVG